MVLPLGERTTPSIRAFGAVLLVTGVPLSSFLQLLNKIIDNIRMPINMIENLKVLFMGRFVKNEHCQ
jgi:hypothetical protein